MAYDVMQAVAPGRYVHRTVHYAFMWAYFWRGAFHLRVPEGPYAEWSRRLAAHAQ